MANNTTAYIKTDKGNIQLIEGTSCSLNFGIADIRDLASRGGTFSKELNAVWNDNNHRILGQLFDINGTTFDFNFNSRVECEIIQDGLVIEDNAYLQLIKINESQKTNAQQSNGSYSVLVKSAQRDLFTKMGAKELTDLDFTYMNHVYNAANVKASFIHTVADGYVYPMTINDSFNFLLTDFRPSIYAKHYFDQIHATNGFSYEVQDWAVFDKLVIPFSNDKPLVDNTDFLVEATKSTFSTPTGTITGWTELQDLETLFNPTTGVYDVPVYLTGGQAINANVVIDFDVVLGNATGSNAYLLNSTNLLDVTNSLGYRGRVIINRNGSYLITAAFTTPLPVFSIADNPLVNGDTIILSDNNTIDIPVGNVLPTDVLTFEIIIEEQGIGISPAFMNWYDAPSAPVNEVTITPRIDVNDVTLKLELTANSIGYNFEQVMNNYIPPKIKQKDFVKAICNMAQLMAFPDPDNSNKIIYQPRDQYLDSGAEKDWREKLVKNENQLVKFLPELGSKRKIFTYKQDDDFYNKSYTEAVNEVYGQAEFVFDTEFKQNISTLELIFSPTPMTQISINAIVPTFIGGAPNVNIRILIHNGIELCNGYNIFDYAGVGELYVQYYPVVSHFDNHYNPTVDINFAVCDYYFYQGINHTNNNLYNLHWRRTMSQMNRGKMLTAMFDLSVADIANLKMNDKIYTRNAWWNFNRVIDYDANGNKNTKVELLSIDDELDLDSFTTKTPFPGIPSGSENPIRNLMSGLYTLNNINYSDGSVIVKGVGNTVGPNLRGSVIGDDQTIEESGYWVNGKNIDDGTGFYVPVDYTSVEFDIDFDVDPNAQSVIYLTTSGITGRLPRATDYEDTKIYIKNRSGGKCTLDTFGTPLPTIDGSTSVELYDLESLTLHANGGIWNIL